MGWLCFKNKFENVGSSFVSSKGALLGLLEIVVIEKIIDEHKTIAIQRCFLRKMVCVKKTKGQLNEAHVNVNTILFYPPTC